MEVRRRALGRGLGALIPAVTYDAPATSETIPADRTVPIDMILPNPYQPRELFSDDSIDELAASIREKGLLQPLLVRQTDSGFELIAGERRFRAAKRAGLKALPVVIREADARESLELALVENLQREDLNPLDEAHAYRRLVEEFGLTQEDVAQRVGKKRSTVANSLRLLQLPEEIRTQLANGTLSAGHARSLLGLASTEEQVIVAREVTGRRLSVRDTETLVRQSGTKQPPDVNLQAMETQLTQALGTRVRIKNKKAGTGTVEIEFYSLAELNGLIVRLTG